MQHPLYKHHLLATITTTTTLLLVLLLCNNPQTTYASSITTSPKPTATSLTTPQTCEFRTINYITDTLPQQCLKSAWSNAAVKTGGVVAGGPEVVVGSGEGGSDGGSVTTSFSAEATGLASGNGNGNGNGTGNASVMAGETTSSSVAVETDLETGELSETSFLSFEEWKKQMLEKAGQKDANIGNRRSGENKRRDAEGYENGLDSFGDEGEIDLDFGAFRSGKKGEEVEKGSHNDKPEGSDGSKERKRKKKGQYQSKDAGTTCKERFSYASIDAGASVKKSHAGAKNDKAVLFENKDTYMLSICSAKNKFIIIQLSDDIWIDTLVLANYEYFSSMFRNFRVSVSDHYPPKPDKWKDLGVFEARNSREIQAFLIENPQIWARYVRIEFLTHYGTEYYCPLSLVRVHGTRMLESWKETEANGEDDEDETEEPAAVENSIPVESAVAAQEEKINAELRGAQEAISELVATAQNLSAGIVEPALNSSHLGEINASLQDASTQGMMTPWIPGFDFGAWMNSSQGLDVCLLREAPTPQVVILETTKADTIAPTPEPSAEPTVSPAKQATDVTSSSSVSPVTTATSGNTTIEITSPAVQSTSEASSTSSSSSSPITTTTSAIISKSQNTTSIKTKATQTSSSPSMPTQQESFFKAVSRRLQLLETNSTLSLKYIEEQSRILREAFSKVEKKQLSKTTTFLSTLNSTVLTELKEIRQQYDEIWQSTVISLESQRDESRREILAISTRLNILADEVVFQKRMSIVQSVLLLLCLGLVIFSRVSSSPLDFPSRSRIFSSWPVESPIESGPESLEYIPGNGIPNGRHWGHGHRRQRSEDSLISPDEEGDMEEGEEEDDGEEDIDEGPPTPISAYSNSDHNLTPPTRENASTPHHIPETPPRNILNSQNQGQPSIPLRTSSYDANLNPNMHHTQNQHQPQQTGKTSPVRAPKKKKGFIRQQQQASPPPEPESDLQFPTSSSPLTSHSPPTNPPISFPTSSTSPSQQQPVPIISTTPASPITGREAGKGHRSSFSIARKPLPALPKAEMDGGLKGNGTGEGDE